MLVDCVKDSEAACTDLTTGEAAVKTKSDVKWKTLLVSPKATLDMQFQTDQKNGI